MLKDDGSKSRLIPKNEGRFRIWNPGKKQGIPGFVQGLTAMPAVVLSETEDIFEFRDMAHADNSTYQNSLEAAGKGRHAGYRCQRTLVYIGLSHGKRCGFCIWRL